MPCLSIVPRLQIEYLIAPTVTYLVKLILETEQVSLTAHVTKKQETDFRQNCSARIGLSPFSVNYDRNHECLALLRKHMASDESPVFVSQHLAYCNGDRSLQAFPKVSSSSQRSITTSV